MKRLSEEYLVMFAIRVITVFVLFCAFFVLLAKVAPKDYMPKETYFSSFTYMLNGEDQNEKLLVDWDYLHRSKKGHEALDVVKETEQVIDIQNLGFWMTPNQCLLIPVYLMAIMGAGVLWSLFGLGHIYELLRTVAFGLSLELLKSPLIFITLPFCAVPLGFGMVISALFALVTLPFELPYLLIRGIVQTVRHR